MAELSRRLGVSEHVLRARESRYGLLQPVRSPGGFRLYSAADEARIRRMQAYLAQGLSAAEAAPAALASRPGTHRPAPAAPAAGSEPFTELRRALDAFDEPAAQAELDRLIPELSLPTVLRDVILPYLADLGERWQRGTASIAAEHFASNLIRGRLAGLARGWGSGHGPLALLACPPGELHDIPLMIFGIALNRTGWRIGYLGPDTRVEELARAAATSHPDLVVLAATVPQTLQLLQPEVTSLARHAPLALAGADATPELARAVRGSSWATPGRQATREYRGRRRPPLLTAVAFAGRPGATPRTSDRRLVATAAGFAEQVCPVRDKAFVVGRSGAVTVDEPAGPGSRLPLRHLPAGLPFPGPGLWKRWTQVLEAVYLRNTVTGMPVVAAPAEIDVTTAGQLRGLLLEAAAATGRPTAVVDLTGTEFCDSSGLHTLLRAHNRAVAEGGGLRLVVPPDGVVRRVLSLTGLDLLLPCFSSLAEALAPAPAPQASTAGNASGVAPTEPGDGSGGGHVTAAR